MCKYVIPLHNMCVEKIRYANIVILQWTWKIKEYGKNGFLS